MRSTAMQASILLPIMLDQVIPLWCASLNVCKATSAYSGYISGMCMDKLGQRLHAEPVLTWNYRRLMTQKWVCLLATTMTVNYISQQPWEGKRTTSYQPNSKYVFQSYIRWRPTFKSTWRIRRLCQTAWLNRDIPKLMIKQGTPCID